MPKKKSVSKSALESNETHITRVKQEDFLAQLARVLAHYDTDGDGVLSDEDWSRVECDLSLRTAS